MVGRTRSHLHLPPPSLHIERLAARGGCCSLWCNGLVIGPQPSRHAEHHSEASRVASSCVSPIFMAPYCKQAPQNAAGWLASGQPGGRFSAPKALSGSIEHRAQLAPSHGGADASSCASRVAFACMSSFSAGVQSPTVCIADGRRRRSSSKGVETCCAAGSVSVPGSGEYAPAAARALASGMSTRRFTECDHTTLTLRRRLFGVPFSSEFAEYGGFRVRARRVSTVSLSCAFAAAR
jgi:hypothetical protein